MVFLKTIQLLYQLLFTKQSIEELKILKLLMMQINGPCNWHIIMYDIIRLLKLMCQFKQHFSFAASWGRDILTTFCTIKNIFLSNGSQPLGRPETINGVEKI